MYKRQLKQHGKFQSTRPVGGRDAGHGDQWSPLPNFNSPVPWETGQALAEGLGLDVKFQSTRPVGDGTGGFVARSALASISIHPPRGGRDMIAVAA